MEFPLSSGFIFKVTSVCTNRCSYCYWYESVDTSILPQVVSWDVCVKFVERLEEVVVDYHLKNITIILHGGEPLLMGKDLFCQFLDLLKNFEQKTDCKVGIGVTTNGVLMDGEWIDIFDKYRILPCVSLDGPQDWHDKNRKLISGKGTYDAVLTALDLLAQKFSRGKLKTLSVIMDPRGDLWCHHMFGKLGLKDCDVLIPDLCWDDENIPDITKFLISSFDTWYDSYADLGCNVRFFGGTIKKMLSLKSSSYGYGIGSNATMVILPHGKCTVECNLNEKLNMRYHEDFDLKLKRIDEFATDPRMIFMKKESSKVPSVCLECRWLFCCCGGSSDHRYESQTHTMRESVYCSQLKIFWEHVWERIQKDVFW